MRNFWDLGVHRGNAVLLGVMPCGCVGSDIGNIFLCNTGTYLWVHTHYQNPEGHHNQPEKVCTNTGSLRIM